MVNYEGEYKLASSENFDEYMKVVGVGMLTRKAANATTPVLSVSVSGDHWVVKQTSTFKNYLQEFQIGVEKEIATPDGRKVKSIVTKEGDVLREKQAGADGKESILIREFKEDGIYTNVSCEGVVCKRFYQRQ